MECLFYSGKIRELITVNGQISCLDLSFCVFEDLPSSIKVNNSDKIKLIKSQFINNFKNVSIILGLVKNIQITDSCFVRCSLIPPYLNKDGCVVRITDSNSSYLSGLSIFGCSASMSPICDRFVVFMIGDEGYLLDSNSTFNRMYSGSGPNIATKKSYFKRSLVIGSVTYGTCTYFRDIEFEPVFENLVFANNIRLKDSNEKANSVIKNSLLYVDMRITDSFFIENEYPLIFACEETQIILTNNFFSNNVISSDLVVIDETNRVNQTGDYSYPVIGRNVGCALAHINQSFKIITKRKFLFSFFSFSLNFKQTLKLSFES